MLGHFQESVLDSGLNVKDMAQISMDGPNINWAFFALVKKKLDTDYNSSIINIGSCGLHVVHNSFKTGAPASGWNVSGFLSSLYYLFKDSQARREDYSTTCGSTLMPLKFVNHRWLENIPVCDRSLTILPSVELYVKAVQEKKFTKPTCKSYEVVSVAVKDKLILAKLHFFKFVASHLQPFLVVYQTDRPMVPFLSDDLSFMVRGVMKCFIKTDKLAEASDDKLSRILEDRDNRLTYKKVNLGFLTEKYLKEESKKPHVSGRHVIEFRMSAMTFLEEVVKKVLNKCPLTYSLVRNLSPVEATVRAVNKDKTTKKARRKANKDQADAVWKVCVPNCFHNGNSNKGNVVQCHLYQTWIHPECVGQNDSDIVEIPTCRTLQQLLDRSSVLESMLVRLEESNRQLVALVGEQRKEMSELRDGMKSANACSYADVVRAPRGVTLLVGNSLVRDIDRMRTADGVETNVCCKSGVSFAEIGDMIVEAANHDKLNGIVVVGGTNEAMGNVSIDELKERTQLLITKVKSVAEAATVGSVLPWRDHDPERLAKVNGAIRETCREMCVKYVDHDGNFTFRDGTVDEAAYVSDGLHLSSQLSQK